MPSVTQVLVSMSQQMYEDIKFITQHNPTQVVDEDTTKMYNHLLDEVRTNFPFSQQVQGFETMTPRTLKYKDALVVVGQLSCLLKILTSDSRRLSQSQVEVPQLNSGQQSAPAASAPGWLPVNKSTPAPVQNRYSNEDEESIVPPAPPAKPAPAAPAKPNRQIVQERAGMRHDEELYGPTPPVHLNDDGTVRFSLDE